MSGADRLPDFSTGDPATPIPALTSGVTDIPAQTASPLKVTAQGLDESVSPLSQEPPLEHKISTAEAPETASIAVVPTVTAGVLPAAAPDLVDLPLDPSLVDTLPESGPAASPKVQQRPMAPAMHRLNTNVSANSSFNTPSSVTSSPETPFGIKFGLYSNAQGYDSFEDLSRVGSRTDLRAQHGTDISASSEDDAADEGYEGGVPAPKAKKSHARKVSFGCPVYLRDTDQRSNQKATSSELEMPSSCSESTLLIPI